MICPKCKATIDYLCYKASGRSVFTGKEWLRLEYDINLYCPLCNSIIDNLIELAEQIKADKQLVEEIDSQLKGEDNNGKQRVDSQTG